MSFLTLVLKNLMRRRSRSVLTVIGIAIGIAAVVAFTSLAWGFESSLANVFKARGTDLIVTKANARSAIPPAFPDSAKDDLLALPHVQRVAGVLCEIFSVEIAPTVIVAGWEHDTPGWDHLKLVKGSWLAKDVKKQVILGALAAESLEKTIGDTVQIETGEFTVAGIVSSAAFSENGAIIMSLEDMQELTHRERQLNFVDVWLDAGTPDAAREAMPGLIRERLKGLTAFSPGTIAQNGQTIQMARAMSIATSVLALVIGAVGVMNTLLMSVFERIQEIGVLLAIGWERLRIMAMILLESVVLSLFGGVAGGVLGVAAMSVLQATPWIHGKFEGEITPGLFGLGIVVALALGALGGLYPAWIGSRMSPANALRQ